MPLFTRCFALFAVAVLCQGCFGGTRETHTARTTTEQFLVSRAAERAVRKFEGFEELLQNRAVALDESFFDAIDKDYVISALRHRLVEAGVELVPVSGKVIKKAGRTVTVMPERIVEVRCGALGIRDKDFGFGIPKLPIPIPLTTANLLPEGYRLIWRDRQEGWAKFQIWVREADSQDYVMQSADLWGRSYYNAWWFFFVGPFDGTNDIYPEGTYLTKIGRELP